MLRAQRGKSDEVPRKHEDLSRRISDRSGGFEKIMPPRLISKLVKIPETSNVPSPTGNEYKYKYPEKHKNFSRFRRRRQINTSIKKHKTDPPPPPPRASHYLPGHTYPRHLFLPIATYTLFLRKKTAFFSPLQKSFPFLFLGKNSFFLHMVRQG